MLYMIILSAKTPVTLITWKWLIACVYILMPYKVSSVRKKMVTLIIENGFSPVCNLWCVIRLPIIAKLFSKAYIPCVYLRDFSSQNYQDVCQGNELF